MLATRAMSAPSSTSQARSEPPSASSAEEARAHGHVPRADLAGPAAAWLALALLLTNYGNRFVLRLQNLLRDSLQTAATDPMPALGQQSSIAIETFGPMLALALVLCLGAMIVARSVAQGGIGFSLPWFTRRKHFDKVKHTRWLTGLLAAVLCTVVVGSALPAALRVETTELGPVLQSSAWRLAAAFALLAWIDAALTRAAWWRSLWMTRRERKEEEREAYGSPELRAARAHIRRETLASEQEPGQDKP